MSHFTVLVKLSGKRMKRHGGDVDDALAEILAPFEESPKDESPFLVFCDKTEEITKEYAEGTSKRVKTPKGELLYPWDERFRVPGTFGSGSHTHETPADCVEVEVPIRDLFPSVEAFAEDYHGYGPCEDGRIGYMHNPNRKWDWYQIGGRWRGHFPLKSDRIAVVGRPGVFDNKPQEGGGDVVKVGDLDMDRVTEMTRENAAKFWRDWSAFIASGGEERSDPFDGPRSRAMDLGLCRVERGPYAAKENEIVVPWAGKVRPGDDRASWHDVLKVITEEEFLHEYTACFCPLLTYAALDDAGWHASGEMGWFGCSSDEANDKIAFQKGFVDQFVKTAKKDDLLVCVDCHI